MTTGDTETIIAWKSKGLSDKSIMPPNTPGTSLPSKLKYIHNSVIGAKFKGSCLKQDKATFTHVANLFIAYELKN